MFVAFFEVPQGTGLEGVESNLASYGVHVVGRCQVSKILPVCIGFRPVTATDDRGEAWEFSRDGGSHVRCRWCGIGSQGDGL